jgi:hypothetical protein
MFRTYLLMFGLPDDDNDDLWDMGRCWRRNVLIIELDIDVTHLVI